MEKEHDDGMLEEMWRAIPDYEGWYEVSDWGRFKRIKAYNTTFVGRILKERVGNKGYHLVTLSKNGECRVLSAHRVVAAAFIGPCPEGIQVNHIDGNKMNNHIENLEYVTQSENISHAYRIGIKSQEGENNNASKLTVDKVHKIREMLRDGCAYVSIAPLFNVSVAAFGHIARGERWAWLKEEGDDERT